LDPAAFRFSDGIVGDPVRFWKRLELQGIGVAGFIKAVLRAPAARVGEAFVWPSAATKPPEEWTAEDYDVFADVEVDLEGSGFQGVTSVRLEIGTDGTWKAFLGPY
jgi:hypothetical protein